MNEIEVDRKKVTEQEGEYGKVVTVTRQGDVEPWLEIIVYSDKAIVLCSKARIEISR